MTRLSIPAMWYFLLILTSQGMPANQCKHGSFNVTRSYCYVMLSLCIGRRHQAHCQIWCVFFWNHRTHSVNEWWITFYRIFNWRNFNFIIAITGINQSTHHKLNWFEQTQAHISTLLHSSPPTMCRKVAELYPPGSWGPVKCMQSIDVCWNSGDVRGQGTGRYRPRTNLFAAWEVFRYGEDCCF